MKIEFDIHPILGSPLSEPYGEFEMPLVAIEIDDIIVMVNYFGQLIPGRLRVNKKFIEEVRNPTELYFNRIRKILTNRIRQHSGASRDVAPRIQLMEIDTITGVDGNLARTLSSGTMHVSTLAPNAFTSDGSYTVRGQGYGTSVQWIVEPVDRIGPRAILADTPHHPWLKGTRLLSFVNDENKGVSFQIVSVRGTPDETRELFESFKSQVVVPILAIMFPRDPADHFSWEVVEPLGTSFDNFVIGRIDSGTTSICDVGKVQYFH